MNHLKIDTTEIRHFKPFFFYKWSVLLTVVMWITAENRRGSEKKSVLNASYNQLLIISNHGNKVR